jgi:hypothetical protein
MNLKIKLLAKVVLFGTLIFAVTLLNNCKKNIQNPQVVRDTVKITHDSLITVHDTTTTNDTTFHDKSLIAISLIGLRSDSGFAYKVGYDLPVIGDSNGNPTASTLRLFENGVELGPAHSVHHDIRAFGLGQFSHWGNTLLFSSSDNTNPLSNGRKYAYKMK